MPPDKPPPLDTSQPLYVSVREGSLVPRFTLAGKVSGYIGAERGEGRAYVWRPEVIVMIPAAEVAAHRKSYTHALANGDLVRRTARDFAAQQREQKAKEQREADASHSGSTSASAGGEQ